MSLKLTVAGKNLLIRAIAGEVSIKFTKIQLGSGADAGEHAVAMSNPVMTLGILKYEISDPFLTLTATYNNSGVEESFYITETGVLTENPDVPGENLLYAYEYVPEAAAERVRSSQDRVVETEMNVDVYVGDAENVTASISQSLAYVARSEYDNFVSRRDNPHNVTAAQVGLGNVQNEVPENVTVQLSNANFPVEVKEYDDEESGTTRKKYAFENIGTGGKLGTMLVKIRTAVQVLLDHINGKNPHGITCKLIGAAGEKHDHSANDLKTGTLGIARGGTGGTTAREARESLGIQVGRVFVEIQAGVPIKESFQFDKKYDHSVYPGVVVTSMGNEHVPLEYSISRTSGDGFEMSIYSETYSGILVFQYIVIPHF